MKVEEQKVMEEMECWQTSEHIKKGDYPLTTGN